MKYYFDKLTVPFGDIYIIMSENKLHNIFLTQESFNKYVGGKEDIIEGKEEAYVVTKQLQEYFSGKRKSFDISLNIEGTKFQKSVWKALCDIPYGETRSYKEVAAAVNNIKAVRAIGQANRANNIPIIIPCHRVIKSDGTLGGFMGKNNDNSIKKFLIEFEKGNR